LTPEVQKDALSVLRPGRIIYPLHHLDEKTGAPYVLCTGWRTENPLVAADEQTPIPLLYKP
jgi:hypothetical protein